jgi:hypothetical protein
MKLGFVILCESHTKPDSDDLAQGGSSQAGPHFWAFGGCAISSKFMFQATAVDNELTIFSHTSTQALFIGEQT